MRTRIIKETRGVVVKYHPEVYVKEGFLIQLITLGMFKYYWKRISRGFDGKGYCITLREAKKSLEDYKIQSKPLKLEVVEEKEYD